MSQDFASENRQLTEMVNMLHSHSAQLTEMVRALYSHSASINAVGCDLEHRLVSILRIVDSLRKTPEAIPKHDTELHSIENELLETIRLASSVSQPFQFKNEP